MKEEYPGIEIESRHGGTGEIRRAPAESVGIINPPLSCLLELTVYKPPSRVWHIENA